MSDCDVSQMEEIMAQPIKYDDNGTCKKCGGINKIIIKDMINSDICECETECEKCNHKDYWAYGWYEPEYEV